MAGGQLVIGSSYGPAGASTRVRALDWLRFLGLEAQVLDYLGTPNVRPGTLLRQPWGVVTAERRLRSLRREGPWERFLVSRSLSPFTRGRLEAILLERAGWGVYDFDDALYADTRGGVHRFFGEAAGWSTAVRGADLVIAGNVTLAEAAAALNPEVRVIPSCVDPQAYPRKSSYTIGAVPRLIWLGSPSTEPYLQAVASALLQVHRLTGARLTVVSGGQRSLEELDVMTDRVTWDGSRTDALLADADCGIMPLPDNPFSRGKCAYKLLQYGAAGLPAVASPIGVNADVIGQLDGLAPAAADSWVDALLGVLQEPEARRRARGEAARRAVEDHYSFDAWQSEFLRALHLPDRPGSLPTGKASTSGPAQRIAASRDGTR